jgi:hypothetical protein
MGVATVPPTVTVGLGACRNPLADAAGGAASMNPARTIESSLRVMRETPNRWSKRKLACQIGYWRGSS